MDPQELSPEREAAIRLHVAGITPRQRELAVAAAGDVIRLREIPRSRLVHAGLTEEAAARLLIVSSDSVREEILRAERRGMSIVTRGDPSWPPLLREIGDGPWALWVRGRLPDPGLPTIVVVGPRRPTPYGLNVTRLLAGGLARAGLAIVSGGARGVDGSAHEAALDAGAPTIAVLGCGADIVYPGEHRRLFDRIAERGGAVVSEHPCGVQPLPHHFPVRNRLLAAWSRAVLVTEGSFQSGSLITARLALEAGREVLAVPGPITSKGSEGTNALIADGARLVRGVEDVLDELGIARPVTPAPDSSPPSEPLDDASARLLAALPLDTALSLDELAGLSGLATGALLSRLVALEARGLIHPLAGGLWLRRPP